MTILGRLIFCILIALLGVCFMGLGLVMAHLGLNYGSGGSYAIGVALSLSSFFLLANDKVRL